MAISNKNSIRATFPFDKLMLAQNTAIPVVTTDEVATAIQVDEVGDATGFTSLTDKLAALNHYCHYNKSITQ